MRGLLIGIALAGFGMWRWTSRRHRSAPPRSVSSTADAGSFARMRTDRDEPSRLFPLEEELFGTR